MSIRTTSLRKMTKMKEAVKATNMPSNSEGERVPNIPRTLTAQLSRYHVIISLDVTRSNTNSNLAHPTANPRIALFCLY